MQKGTGLLTTFIIILAVAAFVGSQLYVKVPPGHVAIADLLGDVQKDAYREGFHFPTNPLFSWTFYDIRQKTHKEQANVPSQDQLQTRIDVSIQFYIDHNMASRILQETGSFENLKNVHLIPKVRSLMREQGKSVERAEDFFQEATQERLQANIEEQLKEFLAPKGIIVEAVLIRDITLPPFIIRAIESKKEREQEVEKQKAELERFRTEQQQKIAQAEAEKRAAIEDAEKKRLLADAEAYHITKITEAIADNPAYIRIQAIEALKAISKDPASKIYFINGDSPQPLPLMHIGETEK